MATYLISYFALRPDAVPGTLDAALSAGMELALLPEEAAILLVEAKEGATVVSQGSPSGVAGQKVTVATRIEAGSAAGQDGVQAFDLIALDGKAVGLVAVSGDGSATLPLVPSAPVGPDTPLPAKPRRNPLAFALGTRIDTPDGPRRIETLRPGDLISTLGNGSQPLRWIGQRHVPALEMALREDLQPVLLDSGVLGNTRAVLISPRHRVLLNDWRAQVYFGEDQVLVPAQALINGGTVRQVLPWAGVTYLHLLFDRHEVILSEAMLSESLHPGATGLGALDPAQRHEIEAIFPDQSLERRRAAFPMLGMAEARALRLPG